MRRATYAIAALLVLAGLASLVPLLRARVLAVRSLAVATASMSANRATSTAGSQALPDSAAASAPTSHAPSIAAPRAARLSAARTLGAVGGKLPRRLVRPTLVVDKTPRTLTVYSAGKPVRVYRIALGRVPDSDKIRQGDDRTPLGRFYVCNKNAQSGFDKALGLSYPDAEDARRGYLEGLVTRQQELAILEAVERGRQPLWDTKLGGMIMIHGGGTSHDWTTGCIAMNDADVDELFPLVSVGTPVVIEQQAPLVARGSRPLL